MCDEATVLCLVASVVREAQDAWPDIRLDAERFVECLAQRFDPQDADGWGLRRLHAADLYLACACAEGDEAAIRAMNEVYFASLDAPLKTMGPAAFVDEVKQAVREKVLVRTEQRRPKILEYRGHGDLGNWLRMVATREAIDQRRTQKPQAEFGDVLMADLTTELDPELSHIKAMYAAQFKLAFGEAVASLQPRQRNLIKYQLIDGLAVDAVATLYGVHRVTVARWLAKARRRLVSATREALLKRLNVNRKEFESIMRLIQSRVDLVIASQVEPEQQGSSPSDDSVDSAR